MRKSRLHGASWQTKTLKSEVGSGQATGSLSSSFHGSCHHDIDARKENFFLCSLWSRKKGRHSQGCLCGVTLRQPQEAIIRSLASCNR